MRRFSPELGLFFGAVAFRLALLAPVLANPQRAVWLDSPYYIQLAHALLDGSFPTIVRTPLYPLFLCLFKPLLPALLAQVLLGGLFAVLVYRLGGLLPGILAALDPLQALFTGVLYTETLFSVLVLAAALLWRRGRGFWTGAVAGLACLARPAGLALGALGFFKLRGKQKLGYFLSFGATVGLWALRNWLYKGFLGLSTVSSVNLLLFWAPERGEAYEEYLEDPYAAAEDPAWASRARAEALRAVAKNPTKAALRFGRGLLLSLGGTDTHFPSALLLGETGPKLTHDPLGALKAKWPVLPFVLYSWLFSLATVPLALANFKGKNFPLALAALLGLALAGAAGGFRMRAGWEGLLLANLPTAERPRR